jgi:hypothetical protein
MIGLRMKVTNSRADLVAAPIPDFGEAKEFTVVSFISKSARFNKLNSRQNCGPSIEVVIDGY